MSGRHTYALVLLMAASLAVSPVVSPVYAQDQQAAAPAATPAAQAPDQPAPQQDQGPKPLTPPPQYQPPPSTSAPPTPSVTKTLNLGHDYSNGPRWFPNFLAPYKPISVAPPVMTNTPKVQELIHDGKMMLSLDQAVSIALENNLDIAVERYQPLLDEANLLLSKSGANGRISFDPTVTGTAFDEYSASPINNPFFAGFLSTSTGAIPTAIATPLSLENHIAEANFQYTQNFSTGTQVQVTFDNTRESTNFGGFDLFNPYIQSTLQLEVTQSLLAGFGKAVNDRYILEAKNTMKIGDSQFAQQVITTVTQVSNDYWELVFARENVKVGQTAVAADQQLYDNNKKQLEIGTMAPLDVITAESQLASDQQLLVQDQTTQLEDETSLLVAMTRDPLAGGLVGVEIVPTTPIFTPDMVENIPLPDAVHEAWKSRPELQQSALTEANSAIEMKATKNLLLPTLNLYGLYAGTGLGGNQTISTPVPTGAFDASTASPVFAASGTNGAGTTPVGYVGTAIDSPTPNITQFNGGIGNDYYGLIKGTYPTFEVGVNLTLPIRNRAAQANNATAQLNHSQQQTQYMQTQNTIVLNVRQAMIAMEQDRAAVQAAQEARVLAQQSYDDEVKRLQLGTSTAFTVTQKQQLLVAAEGTELRDRINLIEAEVNFNQAMGRTLQVHNIIVAGARGVSTYRAPNIPGTPNADTQGVNGQH
jgi:outer membrane protein